MSIVGYRAIIAVTSALVISFAALAGWLFLSRVEVVLADGRAEVLEEMREHAVAETNVASVAATLRHASRWYGTIAPSPKESHERRLLRRVRIAVVRDIVAHMRELTRQDFGDDPAPWIEKYAPPES